VRLLRAQELVLVLVLVLLRAQELVLVLVRAWALARVPERALELVSVSLLVSGLASGLASAQVQVPARVPCPICPNPGELWQHPIQNFRHRPRAIPPRMRTIGQLNNVG
jgi:hypothetical protein